MKLYYYTFTGHKIGLDRVKRAVPILKGLREKGIETMLLTNDFRAGLVARDLGIPESIHIEGIQDIDAIAENGDCIIIDSPEDDHGRLVKYCADFKQVFRFAEQENDKSIHGETILRLDCKEGDDCISSLIIDDVYFGEHQKEERTLFFLGDSDSDKKILNNIDFFKEMKMELLLGHYFYVKYEDDLAKLFTTLHEAEEYTDLICNSSHVVTTSVQTALEAYVTGAKVTYLEILPLKQEEKELFKLLKIIIIIGFDKELTLEVIEKVKLDNDYKKCVNIAKADKIIDEIYHLL